MPAGEEGGVVSRQSAELRLGRYGDGVSSKASISRSYMSANFLYPIYSFCREDDIISSQPQKTNHQPIKEYTARCGQVRVHHIPGAIAPDIIGLSRPVNHPRSRQQETV